MLSQNQLPASAPIRSISTQVPRTPADHESRTLTPPVTAIRFQRDPARELARWYVTVKHDPDFLATLVASTPTPPKRPERDCIPVSAGRYFDPHTGIFYQTKR